MERNGALGKAKLPRGVRGLDPATGRLSSGKREAEIRQAASEWWVLKIWKARLLS